MNRTVNSKKQYVKYKIFKDNFDDSRRMTILTPGYGNTVIECLIDGLKTEHLYDETYKYIYLSGYVDGIADYEKLMKMTKNIKPSNTYWLDEYFSVNEYEIEIEI